MTMDRLAITLHNDPGGLGVSLQFEGGNVRKPDDVPFHFDEDAELPALLKILNAYAFNVDDYAEAELAYLVDNQFLATSQESRPELVISPTLQRQIGETLFKRLFSTEELRTVFSRA